MISEIVSWVSTQIRSVNAPPPAPAFRFSEYLQRRLEEEERAKETAALAGDAGTAEPNGLLRLGFIRDLQTRLRRDQRVGPVVESFVSPARRSEAEQEALGELKLASAGVGLGTAGLLFFPLLLGGLACLFPPIAHIFKSAWRDLRAEKRVTGEVLALAATAETKQSHPIARAILQAAAAWGIKADKVDEIKYEIGLGIKIQLEGRTVRVGSARFLKLHGIVLPADVETLQDRVHAEANSLVLVAVNEEVAGGIVLQPTIRPEAHTILNALRGRGVKLFIVSGDHETPTRRLAEELKMDGYFAAVLPEGKARLVSQLQELGRKVCFVGDGINDSIALKSAHVSVSMRGATTIATDAAQIVLMEGDLRQLPQIFTLADEFAGNMRNNFLAATAPCVVMIGGIFLLGWGLPLVTALYQVSVPFALHNTVRPLLAEKRKLEASHAQNQPDTAKAGDSN